MALYADRKNWPLRNTIADITHAGHKPDQPERFKRRLQFGGSRDEAQQARLLEIADKCPVHRTLTNGVAISTTSGEAPPQTSDDADEHLQRACQACEDLDGSER